MSIEDNHNHFCIYCGAKIDFDQNFCSECGKPVYRKEPEVKKFQQNTIIKLLNWKVNMILNRLKLKS